MDTHQRTMWESMLDEVERCRAGHLPLGVLVDDLRGLYVEADPHDPNVRDDFERFWSAIDGQHELRTEPSAPPGSASEAGLSAALLQFSQFVRSVLSSDTTTEHR